MIYRSSIDAVTRIDSRVIAEVYAHSLRGRVLSALAERPQATIRAVAERLEESPGRVRHQVDALLDLGLVKVTGEEIWRGVLRRRYGAEPVIVWDDDSSPEMRLEIAKATVRLLMGDIAAAAAAGTLARRPDDFEVRMYGEVDDACLEDVAILSRRAFDEIVSAIQEGRERVWESGRRGTEIISALFVFEAPLWRSRQSRSSGEGRAGLKEPLHIPDPVVSRSLNDPSIYLDPQALAKAYGHPVRSKVLTALSERPGVTVREVAERLEESPRRVRHHLDALIKAGLATVTSSDNLSGVVQYRYGAGPLLVDDADQWSRDERIRFTKTAVRLLAADLGEAVAAGTIGEGREDFEVRMYGEVDDACLEQLAALHLRADRGIRKAIYEGRDRVMKSGEAGTEVISALYFFEAPLWRHVVSP
jgi:DNA-binding transcriptional ArsR family regulator